MTTSETTKEMSATHSAAEIAKFFGEIFSFNTSLKLFHWTVTGPGSYAQHVALDQSLDALGEATDRIVETTIAMKGSLHIVIPQTAAPSDIITHCENFFDYVDDKYELFNEDFAAAILDDYQEAIQQLLYRLKRLK